MTKQVTLHNQALFYMDLDPAAGFRKLNFLLQVTLLDLRNKERMN